MFVFLQSQRMAYDAPVSAVWAKCFPCCVHVNNDLCDSYGQLVHVTNGFVRQAQSWKV